MASSIVSTTIDENFPVAGRDNDSQGFRDNFFIIKQNFQAAKTEIEDLQSGSARVDTNNNFNLNNITEATLLASPLTVNTTYASGLAVPTATLSWEEGYVHVVRVTEDPTTLQLIDFPNNKYCQMRLVLFSDSTSSRAITISGGAVKSTIASPAPKNVVVVSSNINPVIVDVFTYDGGLNLFLDVVGTFS